MTEAKCKMAIKYGGSEGGERRKTLWTNPNPSAPLDTTTITLSQYPGGFRGFRVTDNRGRVFSVLPGRIIAMATEAVSGDNHWVRVIKFNNTRYVVINSSMAIGGTTKNPSTNVPVMIEGIK